MLRLLSSPDLWTWIQSQAMKTTRKAAAIAYVTRDDVVRFGDGDLLLVDAPGGRMRTLARGALPFPAGAGRAVGSVP